jgi:hypothetical protein
MEVTKEGVGKNEDQAMKEEEMFDMTLISFYKF